MYYVQFKFDFVELKVRKFQTLHFQQRIKRIILIYHAARRCISLMPQAATNKIEWLHSAFVFIRCTFRCIVHCINSSYSKYSLLKKASEPLARRSQTSFISIITQLLYSSAFTITIIPAARRSLSSLLRSTKSIRTGTRC